MKAATPSCHPVGLMLEKIKLSPSEYSKGRHDGKSIKKFIAVLEIYFSIVGLNNDNSRALFAKAYLTKLAKTWYDV